MHSILTLNITDSIALKPHDFGKKELIVRGSNGIYDSMFFITHNMEVTEKNNKQQIIYGQLCICSRALPTKGLKCHLRNFP